MPTEVKRLLKFYDKDASGKTIIVTWKVDNMSDAKKALERIRLKTGKIVVAYYTAWESGYRVVNKRIS